jgi:hypothetical protein
MTALGFGDHAANRQRFLEFLIVDQRQAFARLAGRFGLHRFEARSEIAEDLAQVFLAHPLDQLALLAHFAHAVEVTGLHGIVLGLFGQIEQRIVDVLEQVGNQSVDAL